MPLSMMNRGQTSVQVAVRSRIATPIVLWFAATSLFIVAAVHPAQAMVVASPTGAIAKVSLYTAYNTGHNAVFAHSAIEFTNSAAGEGLVKSGSIEHFVQSFRPRKFDLGLYSNTGNNGTSYNYGVIFKWHLSRI